MEFAISSSTFSCWVVAWQKQNGRHDLPWQQTRDPYRIWVSEIMLQQTQVATVIPYYARFLTRFPDVAALANAPQEAVMAHWSGLGYYARARNLQRAAQLVCERFGGEFPRDPALLAELPGIGRSTAAAVSAFSFGVRAAILDGNVKRVFARVFGVDTPSDEKATLAMLWDKAEALLPEREIEAYTQGLMDLGATLCTRRNPECGRCPLREICVAARDGRTDELPVAKARKSIPEKWVQVLIVEYAGRVLFEQRPAKGIWGALQSLPELALPQLSPPTEPTREQLIERTRRWGHYLDCDATQAELIHTFTHFRLHLLPVVVELSDVRPDAGIWLTRDELDHAPLPAPIRTLLKYSSEIN